MICPPLPGMSARSWFLLPNRSEALTCIVFQMLKLKIWMDMLTEFGWFITPSHVWAIGHSLLSHPHTMKVSLTHWNTFILHINIKHRAIILENLTASLKYRKIFVIFSNPENTASIILTKSGKSPWIKGVRSRFTPDLDSASLKKFHCWLNSALFIKKFYYWIVCSFLKKERNNSHWCPPYTDAWL